MSGWGNRDLSGLRFSLGSTREFVAHLSDELNHYVPFAIVPKDGIGEDPNFVQTKVRYDPYKVCGNYSVFFEDDLYTMNGPSGFHLSQSYKESTEVGEFYDFGNSEMDLDLRIMKNGRFFYEHADPNERIAGFGFFPRPVTNDFYLLFMVIVRPAIGIYYQYRLYAKYKYEPIQLLATLDENAVQRYYQDFRSIWRFSNDGRKAVHIDGLKQKRSEVTIGSFNNLPIFENLVVTSIETEDFLETTETAGSTTITCTETVETVNLGENEGPDQPNGFIVINMGDAGIPYLYLLDSEGQIPDGADPLNGACNRLVVNWTHNGFNLSSQYGYGIFYNRSFHWFRQTPYREISDYFGFTPYNGSGSHIGPSISNNNQRRFLLAEGFTEANRGVQLFGINHWMTTQKQEDTNGSLTWSWREDLVDTEVETLSISGGSYSGILTQQLAIRYEGSEDDVVLHEWHWEQTETQGTWDMSGTSTPTTYTATPLLAFIPLFADVNQDCYVLLENDYVKHYTTNEVEDFYWTNNWEYIPTAARLIVIIGNHNGTYVKKTYNLALPVFNETDYNTNQFRSYVAVNYKNSTFSEPSSIWTHLLNYTLGANPVFSASVLNFEKLKEYSATKFVCLTINAFESATTPYGDTTTPSSKLVLLTNGVEGFDLLNEVDVPIIFIREPETTITPQCWFPIGVR